MNTALIIFHADPRRGGAERYTWDLAAGLAVRGLDASLIFSDSGDFEPPNGVRPVPIPAATMGRARSYLRFIEQLSAHLSKTRYDVVHAMLPVPACDIYHPHAGLAAQALAEGHFKYEGPVMQILARTANRMNRKRCRFAEVERTLLISTSPPTVLCLSNYVKRSIQQYYKLPATRLVNLFNAVDINRFNPAAQPQARAQARQALRVTPDKVVALIVAQDFARKGLSEAITAVHAVNDQRLVLVVVGKQTVEPYRRLAVRLGVADRVIFAGATQDPYPFYSAADFFVLPTRHDPCSLVVLEALAMGLPVISTVFNGACEIMSEGREGVILSDPSDTVALAAALRQMLDDEERGKMSAAALQLRPKLAYQHHLDQVTEIYRQVAAEKQRSIGAGFSL